MTTIMINPVPVYVLKKALALLPDVRAHYQKHGRSTFSIRVSGELTDYVYKNDLLRGQRSLRTGYDVCHLIFEAAPSVISGSTPVSIDWVLQSFHIGGQ